MSMLGEWLGSTGRVTTPLIKKDGQLVPATWDEALDLVARRLGTYKGHAFVAMASAKCTNEENYILQKFARQVMGTNNVDHCARLCHAPSVTGLVQSFGSGAMTNPIADMAKTTRQFDAANGGESPAPGFIEFLKHAVETCPPGNPFAEELREVAGDVFATLEAPKG